MPAVFLGDILTGEQQPASAVEEAVQLVGFITAQGVSVAVAGIPDGDLVREGVHIRQSGVAAVLHVPQVVAVGVDRQPVTVVALVTTAVVVIHQ